MLHAARNVLCVVTLVVLAGCSSDTATTAKAPEAPAQPMTGRQAFQQMYPMARSWATDAIPALLQSINLTQAPSHDGRAGAWQAAFVSPSRGQARTYTWSATEAEGNLHQGVFAGPDEAVGSRKPFPLAAIKTDSDAAYRIAAEHAADYLKKNPNKPVILVLEMSSRFPDLTWRVSWGESVSTAEYTVFVDASTGKFLEKLRG